VSIAGFGSQAPGADPAAIEAAIVQQIERGGWRRPVLVGHSYGGMLALSLAAAHPGLFGRVVIVDAYPFPMGQVQPAITPEAARQQATAVRAAVLAMTADAFGQQQRAVAAMSVTDPARAEEVAAWVVASDRAAVAEAQFMMLGSDLRPLLPRISQPLLAIGTWRGREPFGFSHDRIAGELEAQYAGAAAHTTIVNDSARHYVMLDDPSWLARTIAEFAGR
jgi:pimeloyl-ACP methyl ester carboxylesterase